VQKFYDGPERRKYIRIPEKDLLSREPLTIKSFDAEGVYKDYATTKDLSEGGILFLSGTLIPIGTYIKLQFYVHDWDKHKVAFYKQEDIEEGPFMVIGKVVREEVLDTGHFDIGVEFIAVDAGHKQALRDYIKKMKPDA
jgi:c-di-GMP-binding flagellar brake protein YcgR